METKVKVLIVIAFVLELFLVVQMAKTEILSIKLEETEKELADARTHIELLYKEKEQDSIKKRVEIAGEIYSIDPQLLEAIERLETGNYTSKIYLKKNNTWGAYNGSEYLEFDNDLQSSVELARTLKKYYIDEGLETIEEIGKKYCPSDENWALKVKQIYEQLGE